MPLAVSRFAGGSSAAPWDRGPAINNLARLDSVTIGLGPHARTLRVDSGALTKNAMIIGGTMRLTRATAAAPAGIAYISLAPGNADAIFASITGVQNAVDGSSRDEATIPNTEIPPVNAGSVSIYTKDNSTGGTIDYQMAVAYVLFT